MKPARTHPVDRIGSRAHEDRYRGVSCRRATKDLLRFSTAGSVDDGKSTLIGRLLYDSQNVYEDQ